MAKSSRNVDININGRDNASRTFKKVSKGAVDMDQRLRGMGATALQSVVSVTALTQLAGNLATQWEDAVKQGGQLQQTIIGVERAWARHANEVAKGVPMFGRVVHLGNMLNSGYRDSVRIQGEMLRIQERLANQHERAARASQLQRTVTQQEVQARRRLELATATGAGGQLQARQRHATEDAQTQFRQMRERAISTMPSHMLDGELARIARAEADTLKAIAAEFESQRRQLRDSLASVLGEQQGRAASLKLDIDTANLRAAGRDVEAEILRVSAEASQGAADVYLKALEQTRGLHGQMRAAILDQAKQEQQLIAQSAAQRIAAIEQAENRRRQMVAQSTDDALEQARIDALRAEVEMGNKALRVDLERAEIQRDEQQRRRALTRLLEDQTLDAERRLSIEKAIARSRDQEQRRIAMIGTTENRGQAPEAVQARSARFLTRSSTPAADGMQQRTEQNTREMVKISRDTLKALQAAQRTLQEISRDRIILAAEGTTDQ